MEFTFYIDKVQKTIIEQFSGEVTLAKVTKILPSIWAHPDYSNELNAIVDLRNCTLHFSESEMDMFMQTVLADNRAIRGKVAIIVSKPLEAAVGSLYGAKVKAAHSSSVFCSNSEVIHYLGVDPSIFEKLLDPGINRIEVE